MFGLPFGSITEKLMAVLITILVLIVLILNGLLWWDKIKLEKLRNENFNLAGKLAVQNAAIDGLKTRNDALIGLAEQASKDAGKLRTELAKKSESIKRVPLSGNECDDLKAVIDSARSIAASDH